MNGLISALDTTIETKKILSQLSDKELGEIKQTVLNDFEIKGFISKYADVIDDEMIDRGLSVLIEYIRSRNRNQKYNARLKLYANNFHVDYSPNPDYIKEQKKEFWKTRLNIKDLSMENQRATVQDIEPNLDNMALYGELVDMVKNFDAKKKNMGLWVQGAIGVGKTYMVTAFAKELNKKESGVTIIEFSDFVEKLKNSISSDSDRIEKDLNKIKFVDVLVIDDIGAEYTTQWVIDTILKPVMNHRYKKEMLTIVTSNLTKQQYKERLESPANSKRTTEDNKAMAKQLFARIDGLMKEVSVYGDNRREQF